MKKAKSKLEIMNPDAARIRPAENQAIKRRKGG